MNNKIPGQRTVAVHSLTLKSETLVNVLHTPLTVYLPGEYNDGHITRGIWDTGASATVITQEVVDKLGLKSTGITQVNTASERDKKSETYLVDVLLKDGLVINGVQVTVGTLIKDIDCLIGMDIISMGDFSITNHKGKTCFSFRIPSLHEIDYAKHKAIFNPSSGNFANTVRSVGRNSLCPCGSGKKYKACCIDN